MKKRLISLLLAWLLLCLTCALAEEEQTTASPYFELYRLHLAITLSSRFRIHGRISESRRMGCRRWSTSSAERNSW